MYQELKQSISRFASVEQKLRILRRYKRRETLRIGLRDLLKMADVATTTLELSNLAEAALQHCYEIGRDQVMKPKYGTPLNEEGTAPCRFAIIGMGKLGGYELNFSSDIDLIFVYSDDARTDMGTDNSEYFSRFCEFIIKAMSEILPPQRGTSFVLTSVCVRKVVRVLLSALWRVTKVTMKGGAICGNVKL